MLNWHIVLYLVGGMFKLPILHQSHGRMFVRFSMLFCDDLFSFIGFVLLGKGAITKLILRSGRR